MRQDYRVAVVGAGKVGSHIIHALDAGIPGFRLSAISVNDRTCASRRFAHLRETVPVVGCDELEPFADIVIECAPAKLVAEIIVPFLQKGKQAIVLSVNALLLNEELAGIARDNGGQIVVPTGALAALDAVIAARETGIHTVRMVTRKPPVTLSEAPYIRSSGLDLAAIREPLRVFAGSTREAAAGFPKGLNIAAALALAGVGPDRTELEIWADPGIERNCHRIDIDSEAATFSASIETIPSSATTVGNITSNSVVACLRKYFSPLRVGS